MMRDGYRNTSRAGSKNVWIVNHYAHVPSRDGGGARHLSLAERLPQHGWNPTLIIASTRHPNGVQALPGARLRKLSVENGVRTLWVKTNKYGRSLPLRFVGMVLFALNLSLPWTVRGLGRPDVVVGSTVHPFAALAGLVLSRRFRVPFVYEVRDVWPESLYDLANIGPNHPVSRLLATIDRSLIKHSVLVFAPLPHVDKHLAEQGYGSKPFVWVANGADVAPPVEPGPAEAESTRDKPFTFMYLGAHGRANALDIVLQAFDRVATNSPAGSVKLRLVGDGPRKEALQKFASTLHSSEHITFEDRIPRSEVLARAQEADCLVANLYDHPVFRFGISPNKYFMYMSAGKPVISGSSAPNNAIKEADAGFAVVAGSVDAYAEAMGAMRDLSEPERQRFAANGRRALEQNYTFDALTKKFAGGLDRAME